MLINIQQFLQELLTDLAATFENDKGEVVKLRMQAVVSRFNLIKSSGYEDKQRRLINAVLQGTYFVMEHRSGNLHQTKLSAAMSLSPDPKFMVIHLIDFECRSNLFDLFNRKSALNPEKMQKLAYLLDFCAKHPDSLESAEIDTDKLQLDKGDSLWNFYLQPAPEPKSVTASQVKHRDTNMVILGGFIAVLGIAAVAIALTLLSASAFGFGLAVLGVVGMAGGAGIGIYGLFANRPLMPDGNPDDLYEKLTNN